MNVRRKTGFVSAVISAIVAVIAVAVGCFFAISPSSFGDRDFGTRQETRSEAPSVASPHRQYNSISVEQVNGLAAYVGITTVGDLKKNITVKGTYTAGDSGSKTVTLSDEEYVINVDDVAQNDADKVYYADDNYPPSFNLSVSCGSLVASVGTVDVKNPAGEYGEDTTAAANNAVPQYAGLKVELPDGAAYLENIHTEETLKKFLVVKGVSGDAETVIANKELYDISVSGSLTSVGSVTVTATYKFNENGSLTTDGITGSGEFAVKAGKALGATVAVSSAASYIDGTWTKADKTHAFVAGMSTTDIASSLDMYLEYSQGYDKVVSNGSVVKGYNNVTLPDGNDYFADTTGLTVVKIAVYNQNATDGISSAITLSFESLRVIAITATHNQISDLTSGTSFSKEHFTVHATYNNGTESTDSLGTESYNITPATYVPSAENIEYANEHNGKYVKSLTVSLASDETVFVVIETNEITLSDPRSINSSLSSIYGNSVADQTVLTEFDYSGITASAKYGTGIFTSPLYLSEYKDAGNIKITYYKEDGATTVAPAIENGKNLIPSREVKWVLIEFTYITSKGEELKAENSFQVNVLPAQVDFPSLSVSEMDFSDNCFKQIRGIDFANVKVGDISVNMLTVEISDALGIDGDVINAQYVAGSTTETTKKESKFAEYIMYGDEAGKITFKRGGTFTVKLTLEDNNYGWKDIISSNPSRTSQTLTYTITVNKAELNIKLNGDEGTKKIGLTYGALKDNDDKTTFTGWENRVQYSLMGSTSWIESENDVNRPEFTLLYFGFTTDGKTYTYSKDLDASGNYAETMTTVCPKDVGSYGVAVYTAGNSAYKASISILDNTATVEVSPKEIDVGNAVDNTKVYSRQGWSVDEFINVTAANAELEYGEKTDKIIEISGDPNEMESGNVYIKAGTYAATLTFKNKNYVWKGGNTNASGLSYVGTTFKINPAKFEFTAKVENPSLEYGGTTTPDPSVDKYYNTTSGRTEISQSDFYPVIGEVKYYAADATDSSKPSSNEKDIAKISEWDVGTYFAKYTTSANTSVTVGSATVDETGCYDPPEAYVSFEITPKKVPVVTVSSDVPEYDGNAHDFVLNNFDGAFMTFGSVSNDSITEKIIVGMTSDESAPITLDLTSSGTGTDTDGKFYIQAKHAATYSFVVSFGSEQNKKNYRWDNGSSDDIALSFEIARREIVFTDNSASTEGGSDYDADKHAFRYKGNGVNHGKPQFDDMTDIAKADGVVITYTVYDEDETKVTVDLLTLGVGSYTFEFDFTVGMSAVKTDYQLPATLPVGFSVVPAELIIPTAVGNADDGVSVSGYTLTAVYNGNVYDYKKYFVDSDNNAYNFAIGVTVTVGELKTVDTYDIKIKPATNYTWAEGQTFDGNAVEADTELTFTFEITRRVVEVLWDTSSLSVEYDGDGHKPTATVKNICGNDKVEITVGAGKDLDEAKTAGGKTVINADKYNAYAFALTGADSGNYLIEESQVDSDAYRTDFTIMKQVVALPTASYNFTFGENQDGLQLERGTTNADKGWSWLFENGDAAPAVTTRMSGKNMSAETLSGDDTAVLGTDGKFTYKFAGTYTITLTIGHDDNFRWAGDTDTNIATITVSIAKAQIARPTNPDKVEYSETEADRTISLGKYDKWSAIAASGTFDPHVSGTYVGKDYFDGAINLGCTVSVANGTFAYTDAGKYTVTLTIGASNNFQWVNGGNTTTLDIEVERKIIASPTLEEFYALWVDNDTSVCPKLVTDGAVDGSYYSVTYGRVSIGANGAISYIDESNVHDSKTRDEYFVRIKLIGGDDRNVNNYIWANPYVGVTVPSYLHATHQVIEADGDMSIYLHYGVTRTLLNVGFEFESYIFGTNSDSLLGDTLRAVDDEATTTVNEATTFYNQMSAGNVQIVVTFTNRDTKDVSGFTWNKLTDASGSAIARAAELLPWSGYSFSDTRGDLVNNLPWEAGTYDVVISLTYAESADYQDMPNIKSVLVVKPYEISVKWNDTKSVDYDGAEHTLTAEISGALPQKPNSDAYSLTLQTGYVDANDDIVAGGKVKNAGEYVFKISAINGTGSANFSFKDVNDAADSLSTLMINKLAVTVAPTAAGHTYGDAFGSKTPFGWNVSAGSFVVGEADIAKDNGYFTFTVKDGETVIDQSNTLCAAGDAYKVSLDKLTTDAANAFFNNYNITFGADAQYTIAKRDITVTATGKTSVYGADLATLEYTTDDNVATGETEAIVTLAVYEKDGTTALSSTSNIGKYDIVTKSENPNYNITFDKGVYEITPATLSVAVNINKYYGESVPADFKKTNADLYNVSNGRNGKIYNITGFVEGTTDETDFYPLTSADEIKGSFDYKIGADNKITFEPNGLAWGNYVFAAAEGKLTVDLLTVNVTLNKFSVVYYSTELPSLNTLGDGYTVKYSDSSFGLSEIVFDENAIVLSDIFTVSSDAIKDGKTNNVGTYDIEIQVLSTDYAEHFIVKSNATDGVFVEAFIITPAALTNVVSIADGSREFNQKHKAPTVPSSNFATTVDGVTATIKYITRLEADSAPTDSDWESASSELSETYFFHADKYVVFYLVSALNHESEMSSFKYEIKQSTTNAFNTGANGMAINYEGKIFADIDSAKNAAAWKYGGYKTLSDGAAFYDPSTKYDVKHDGTKAVIEINVYYSADGISFGTTAQYTASVNVGVQIYKYFEEVWKAMNFDAGVYRIELSMEEDTNFNAPEDFVGYFAVGKAPLIVTPQKSGGEFTATYGESFGGLGDVVANFSGWVLGQNETTAKDFSSINFVWKTTYKQGDNATSSQYNYVIEIDDAAKYTYVNYEFDFKTADLIVNKRVVTINIADKKNHFNLYDSRNSTADHREAAAELEYKVVGDTQFYNGEVPITLRTRALGNYSECVESSLTNNVGTYPIYAIFKDSTFANNYTILFDGCSSAAPITQKQDDADDPITGERGGFAGIFTIEISFLYGEVKASTKQYDGSAVSTSFDMGDNPDIKVEFVPTYYQYGDGNKRIELDGAPINAGSYRVEYSYNGNTTNYTTADAGRDFEITQAPLTVSLDWRNSSTQFIQYGTPMPQKADYFTATERFSGYKLTYSISAEDIARESAKEMWSLDNIVIEIKGYTTTTAAGNTLSVEISELSAPNYKITYSADASIYVVQRTIDVEVYGVKELAAQNKALAQGVYSSSETYQQTHLNENVAANLDKFFKVTNGDWKGGNSDFTVSTLLPKLTISNPTNRALDVGTYNVIAKFDNGNYDINIIYKSGESVAHYEVLPAEMYVYVTGKDANSNADYARNFSVVYGNDVLLKAEFVGLQGGQTFESLKDAQDLADPSRFMAGGSVTHDLADKYTAWVTDCGGVKVTYSGDLWFKNYNVNFEECTFQVTQRQISIGDITNAIYAETSDGVYNNGVSGKEQHAVVTFTDDARVFVNADPDTADAKYKLPTLGNGYSISYVYKANASETYVGGKAPNKAGEYEFTVTLSDNSNYMFASGAATAKSDYTIEKQLVSLSWNKASINDYSEITDDNEKDNTIANFVSDIMRVTDFRRFISQGDSGNADTISHVDSGSYDPTVAGTYTFNSSDGLKFRVYNTGYYVVDIELLNAAVSRNYYLNSDNQTSITLALIVSSNGITFVKLSMDGWVYGSAASTPTVEINPGEASNITYMYARLTSKTWEELTSDENHDKYFLTAGFDRDVLNSLGLDNGIFTLQQDQNVGIYVLRAYYSMTGQSSYCIYRITPKPVAIPTLDTTDANGKYTGRTLALDIAMNTDIIRVEATQCGVLPVTGGVRLTAVNANPDGYAVKFTLRSDNYMWATDGDTTLYWKIAKADENVSVDDIKTGYAGYTAGYTPTATTLFGGSVNFRYLKKGNETAAPDPSQVTYTSDMPTAVGSYWIYAYVNDDVNNNYNGGADFALLTIEKAVLTATPTATVIYGNAFDPTGANKSGEAHYEIVFTGYVGNDFTEPTYVTSGVIYKVYGADGNEITAVGDRMLGKGAYRLALSVINTGEVYGLESANYRVVPADGTFTVTAREIAVRIGNARSIYGDPVVPDSASLEVTTRLADEYKIADVSTLGIELGLVGHTDYAKLPYGSYSIVANSYVNTNYDIVFTPGSYTVEKRQIRIGDKVVGGGTVYSDIVPTEVKTFVNVVDGDTIVPVYTYTTLDNELVGGTGEMPREVGTYYVRVSQANGNYELVDQVQFTFVIGTLVIDGSKIKAVTAAYDNKTLVPVIDFGEYSSEICTVEYLDDRMTVGIHKILLRLKDTVNTSWLDSSSDEYTIDFEIVRANNVLGSLSIRGWTYGESGNAPTATSKFGAASDYIFRYYAKDGNEYTLLTGVPVNAGTYYVAVYIPQSANYLEYVCAESEYVSFEIAKATHAVPSLAIVTSGEGKNDTYTGQALPALVQGFDAAEMSIVYDGISNIYGDTVTVYATNAGVYTIRLSLKNSGNYRWADGAELDDEGYAVLTWTVAKKKVAVPTDNTSTFIVDGSTLVYIPNGFDAEIMSISGNTTSYGGTFRVTVTLKDPDNYEWATADGEVVRNAYDFTWKVVGANTVFTIVMVVLGLLAGCAIAAVVVQFLLHKKKLEGLSSETGGSGAAAHSDTADSSEGDAE